MQYWWLGREMQDTREMWDTREMQGRGKCREGQRGMSSEGWRIWSHQDWLCNIIDQHIKFYPSDDFMDISDTTHPNSAIDSLWLTHSLEAVSHSSSSQVIGSSHLSIYILFFPWWVTVFHFIIHFLSDLSFEFVMLFYDGTFWKIPMTHWWAITYRSQKCCLVIQDFPMYIRRERERERDQLECLKHKVLMVHYELYSQALHM